MSKTSRITTKTAVLIALGVFGMLATASLASLNRDQIEEIAVSKAKEGLKKLRKANAKSSNLHYVSSGKFYKASCAVLIKEAYPYYTR